jgi:hypothetical protein
MYNTDCTKCGGVGLLEYNCDDGYRRVLACNCAAGIEVNRLSQQRFISDPVNYQTQVFRSSEFDSTTIRGVLIKFHTRSN